MKPRVSIAIAALFAMSGISSATWAADKAGVGKLEYQSNCASCHGNDGKGGAYVDFLKVTPPDLSQLAKKNGGVFPLERVYSVIDGRQEVKGHGPRDMPVWGRDYQIKAGEHYGDVAYDPEVYVRGRILALIDYLNRLQAK
jgi:mono/diheme cytochrome c family protein